MTPDPVRVEIDRRPIAIVLLSRLKRQLWVAAFFAVFLWLLGQAPPTGLTVAGWSTLCVFALCVALWSTGLLPLAVTSLLAMALIPLVGVMPASDAYGYFGSKVVFFILGAFMLGAALTASGLSQRLAILVVRRAGRTSRRLVLSVFLLCAAGSTVMSTHAVAAMVFPIVLDIAKAMELPPRRSQLGMALFLALAWGCIIGGGLTVLGGGRAPLAIGLLEEATGGERTIAFTEYIALSAPLIVLLLGVGIAMLRRIEPEVASTEKGRQALERRLHELGKMSPHEQMVGLVMVATIVLWATAGDSLGLANIAIVSMAALFTLGGTRWSEVEGRINWGIVLMYGGAICLGGAMQSSGAAAWLTDLIVGGASIDPRWLMVALGFTAAMMTELMSNSAVVAMLMPPALSIAQAQGIDPVVMTMAIVLPTNFSFIFPVATPVNAIAWSAGYFDGAQMMRRGLLLHLAGLGCLMLLVFVYWPALGLL